MFLKKNKFHYIIILIFFLIKKNGFTETNEHIEIIKYLSNFENFSASFIQTQNYEISEGVISIGDSRVRTDYKKPSEIIIILDEDKGMYYNVDLQESEFFDPRDSFAWFFFKVFKNPEFLIDDSEINKFDNNIVIEKNGEGENNYNLKVFFENKPLVIRKIELNIDEQSLTLTLFEHKYNNKFKEKYFKLIAPSFFN